MTKNGVIATLTYLSKPVDGKEMVSLEDAVKYVSLIEEKERGDSELQGPSLSEVIFYKMLSEGLLDK